MKKIYHCLILVVIPVLLMKTGKLGAQVSQTFIYTGSVQSFTVPTCVSTITMDVRGAQGGANVGSAVPGGLGGLASGVIAVTPGQVLSIFVGGQNGYNGGGSAGVSSCTLAMGGNGGGASDVRSGGIALTNRIIVGAGGGGGGGDRANTCGRGTGGGGGGGYYGGGGGSGYPQNSTTVPTGGTQTAGGNAGTSTFSGTQNGLPGILGFGGDGGTETSTNQTGGNFALAGGDGGGLIGASGQQPGSNIFTGQSGAGGSSYIGSTLTNTSTTSGIRTGNGIVIFSYSYNGAVVSATASPVSICTGASINLSSAINPASSGSLLSYTWSPGGSNSQNITTSPTGSTTYTVRATNSLGCISNATVNVTVFTGVPVLSIVNTTTSVCPNNSVILTASGAVLYSWTGGATNGVPFIPVSTSNYTVTGTNSCGSSTAVTGVTVSPLIITATASPSLICALNTATITTGGASSYTLLPGPLTGTNFIVGPPASAIYTINGSNASCSGSTTLSLVVNANPTLSITSSTTTVCEGSPANLTATGALSYTWQPGGSTGSSFTLYPTGPTLCTVLGTNSLGCVASAQQIILTIASPTLTLGASKSLICPGITVTLTAGGANTYSWSTGPTTQVTTVDPLSDTSYSLTGTSTINGCSSTKTISISVFTVNFTVSGPSTVCAGTQVNLNASGPGSTSYSWSNGATAANIQVTPNASTLYVVSALTQTLGLACPNSGTVVVTINHNPTVTAVPTKSIMCSGEKNTIQANGALTYLWNTSAITNSISITASNTGTLNYSVTGTDNNGCVNTASASVKVNSCVGINETAALAVFVTIFPNPSNGIFTLTLNDLPVNASIRISNTLGHVIKNQSINSENTVLDLEKEANGIYFLEVLQNNKGVYNARIVKQ